MASSDLFNRSRAHGGTTLVSRRALLRSTLSIAAAPLALSGIADAAASEATGRISFRLVRAGFVLGFAGGSGRLRFNGERYNINVGGVSFGATIGASSADFTGRVYNLRRVSDIEGSYTATGAGLAVAGGGTTARLRNSRGVVLEVSGKQIGFMASIDLSGMRITLAR